MENGVPVIQVVGSDQNARFVPLGIGKSVVLDLPRDIKDVLVADPTIANAVVRSARRAYLIGVKVGQTNMFFFDAEGRQIAGFDIAVQARPRRAAGDPQAGAAGRGNPRRSGRRRHHADRQRRDAGAGAAGLRSRQPGGRERRHRRPAAAAIPR